MLMNIAICDDEKIFIERINDGITGYFRKNDMDYTVTSFTSGEDFIALGENVLEFNLVFLDICMENSNGLEVAKFIRQQSKDILIVFVSAFIDYSVQGYHFDALRYILKDAMLGRAIEESLDTALSRIEHKNIYIEEEFNEGKRKFALCNLYYIECIKHWLYFHIYDGNAMKVYKTYKTMKSIEEKYFSHNFLEVRKGVLVNPEKVKNVLRYEMKLDNDDIIVIPKEKYMMVKNSIMSYREDM